MTKRMIDYYRQVVGLRTGNPNLDDAIYNYLLHGLEPGSFTRAVLENNLSAAAAKADSQNAENLTFIVRAVAAHMPIDTWGSPEKVRAWLNDANGHRADYKDYVLERATMMKMEDQ